VETSLVATRVSRIAIVAVAAGLFGLTCTPTSTGIPTGGGGTGVNRAVTRPPEATRR
jgi:hypothetical protein